MLENLLSPEIQNFIRDHQNDDEKLLVLQSKHVHGVPSAIVAGQISARRKAKEKLPLFYHTPGIIYPPTKNLEQSSSERTAIFKASLSFHKDNQNHSLEHELKTGVDLTGGFGVDTFFLSKICGQMHCIEPDGELLEITKHNHDLLGGNNIIHHHISAEAFLENLQHRVDFIYIDPSRRIQGKKVFTLKDSKPDVVSLQHHIFKKTNYLLVKAAPLLDIKLGTRELLHCKKVFVVAVENEVKELLFLCEQGFESEAAIEAVNLKTNEEHFEFSFSQESHAEIRFSNPLTYIYEPNAAILKAGAFKSIARYFDVDKLHQHTHLYTSDLLHTDFPGRIFETESHIKSDPKIVRQHLPEAKANVLTRNYPLQAEALKKKLMLADGGKKYLLAFTGLNDKFLVLAGRIK